MMLANLIQDGSSLWSMHERGTVQVIHFLGGMCEKSVYIYHKMKQQYVDMCVALEGI